ncbi:LysR family transcriptional regulator [Klebsiella pneumoniae]|nr:LysR family transcriptional regulator [Klebsiella pneumoniae]
MDLRRLLTLRTILEEGSFAKAASKLCCTQSTVTFQFRQLEAEYGVQLFEKIGRRMVPTDAARNMMPHIHEMMVVINSIKQAVQRNDEPEGELRLAVGETLLSYKIPQVLKSFKKRAPNVLLSLQSQNCYTIRDSLLANEIDLGIFYRVGNDASLIMENYGEHPLVLVASPELALVDFTRGNQHIPVSFIINEKQCVFRLMFESVLRQRKITIDSTIELISIESIKQCVMANTGVTYLPRFTVEKELRAGLLQELPLSPRPETLSAVCAHHSGKVITPAMELFIQSLRESLDA